MQLEELQKKYPEFLYEKYDYKIKGKDLEISFTFKIGLDIKFNPKIIIKDIDKKRLELIGKKIENLIFHLGLIEMISYWKATCSPKIIIKAGYLDKKQIKWWQNLIIKGMSQFFYENKIKFQKPHFICLKSEASIKKRIITVVSLPLKNRYLVPFAGGRDSIITLEKLKEKKKEIILFSVNPNKYIQRCAKASEIEKQIIIKRNIDKKLLELNKEGFLNGHTPFTALLSFLSVICGILFNYKNIVFSNEKSANEGNIKYLERIINHQWSKSSEFEKKFKDYCKKYLVKDINYYSFLRKYTDFEISKIFTKYASISEAEKKGRGLFTYSKYFSLFSSCNAPMKIKSSTKNLWCNNCPKCLFVYLTLYPYLEKKELLKIFKEDLFEKKELLPIMKALIGEAKFKPFECVGTYKESRLAFDLSLKKALRQAQGKPFPYLLQKYDKCRKSCVRHSSR